MGEADDQLLVSPAPVSQGRNPVEFRAEDPSDHLTGLDLLFDFLPFDSVCRTCARGLKPSCACGAPHELRATLTKTPFTCGIFSTPYEWPTITVQTGLDIYNLRLGQVSKVVHVNLAGKGIMGVESESHSCQRNATLTTEGQEDASRVD